MLRILFLMRSLEIGGAERQLVELVRNIDHTRFEIQVVTFYNGGALRPLLEDLPGVKVTSLGKASRWDLISFFRNLLGVIRTYRPHVIQSFLDVPNSFNVLAGKLTGTKVILGASASFVDFSRYDWTAVLVYKTGAFLSHFADQIIANSNAGEKYNVEHGYSAKNICVIHNGIDTRTFHSDKTAGNRMRTKWGLSADEKVIGIVGRIDPMKDHSTFLHAAVQVFQQFPNSRFVCIGRGPQDYRDEMQKLSASLLAKGKVLWISDCEDADLPAAYNAFDLLVSSSYGEGLPVVLGEGMSSGIPCVVTDVGDSALAVGETGLAVPPKNPGALADAICQILEMPEQERNNLGQKARQRVLDYFSIEKMAAAYQAAFETLAQK
jgi:glycosyltransferase involved in cell wall biosynthesis